eukprot:TRINITY_DN41709_c0_g1_i1.p1 TRINITY_DN41709_c0_g1~~TRINITY_DN41709_c0_g1_i1.p1  ORF type:complete len:257 (+),score=11.18 TRINITY_DN41709_c0_g1_i1:46-816(+)
MLKCVHMSRILCRSEQLGFHSAVGQVAQCSMFTGSFHHKHLSKDNSATNILYLNASHGPDSLVGVGARVFLDNLSGNKKIKEVDLWNNKEQVQYKLQHAIAKLKILKGQGSKDDEELFAPVLDAAETVNAVDMVVIATPMWNFTIPYVLKQYIDTIVQPGINFNDTPDPEATERAGRVLVVVSSAGSVYPPESPIQDFVNPYLKQIFGLMGFTQFFPIFIQGTAQQTKLKCLSWTEKEAVKTAQEVNNIVSRSNKL